MKEKILYTATTFFQPFPDEKTVFDAAEQELLLPIGLLAYHQFDPANTDQVLIAMPIEPHDGEVGSHRTREFHTASCTRFRFGYSLKNGKWKLDCDPRFFLRFFYSPEYLEDSDITDFYRSIRAEYDAAKSFYQANHFVDGSDYEVGAEENAAAVHPARKGRTRFMTLGGRAPWMDGWLPFQNLPAEFSEEFQAEEVAIYNAAGNKYHYLGHVPGGKFNGEGDGVYFFYEPISKSVQAIFDSPVVGR